MNRATFLRALRAAAQVSSVAVAGCGGASASPDAVTPVAAASTSATSGTSTATLCEAKLKAAFPGGDHKFWDRSAPKVADPDLLACCTLPKAPAGLTSDEIARFRSSGCCHVAGVKSTEAFTACTPWGPPMPPEFDLALAV